MRESKTIAAALGSVSLLALSHAAMAQTEAAASAPAQLQEVVVTAQKRSENVQTVPISMTALTGKSLTEKSVTTLADLQFAAPSLSVENAGLTQSVNIRGIGLASGSPNAANGVATYVDGVFQPPIVSAGSYYDLADVEVLRGPQGTFVGSNSTGGAIFINSQSPKLGRLEGYGMLGGGTYGALLGQGAVNLPLGDTLAVRVAINDQQHDSYYTDHGPYHDKPGRLDELDYRLGIQWKPASFYQATFKLESIQRETGGYAYQPVPGTTYGSDLPAGAAWHELYYNAPTANNERAIQGSLTQQFQLPGDITLKSITAYQNKQIHNLYDVDAAEVPVSAAATANDTEDQFVREKVYTQEFDLLSPTERTLSWIAGGYFQRNRIDVIIEDGAFPTHILVQNKKTTLGVFGQVSYRLSPTLVATVGLRYSNYSVDGSGDVLIGAGIPGFPPGGLDVANTGGHEEDHALTGKANIDWTFAPHNLLYAFVARGYKSGGIETPTTGFLKETVWNYEIGWKSTLLDGHMKTQLDAFYNDYNNFQFDTVDTATGQGAVQNVPSATIAGVEAQAQVQYGGLRGDAAASYVHSRLGDYKVIDQNALPAGPTQPQCATGQTVGCTDYTAPGVIRDISGAPNLFSPEFTFNAGAEYAFDIADGFVLTPRMNYSYQSSQESSPSLDAFYKIPGRSLVSALVSLEHGPWLAQLRVTNALNKIYVTGFSVNGGAGDRFYGAPREVMFVLQRSF
ncbi:TonB-dependent receptor [Phenylobacterium montanum]|uniref:TonB-dependent receptor n=1 Tax=Phenylobacterium montanum TaxID=2823693 RepID=A0A975G0N4_9CAUL|nr:TonB-dependent receptor [Caulobacter sp. S6]QUD88317.1 TonB-dependent receptor [Caulobacter sp. S6]